MTRNSNNDVFKYRDAFKQKLKEKKNGTFSLIGEYVNSKTPVLIRHNVCGYEWETKPSNILSAPGLKGCPECQRRGNSLTSNEFELRFNKRFKGEFIIKPGTEYTRQTKPLYLIHAVCGLEFETYWGTFQSNPSCPHCREHGGRKRKTTEQFKQELRTMYNDEFTILSAYTGALNNVTVQHNDCGNIWETRASHLLQGHGCPICKSSRGERLVRSVLNELNISFSEQVKFPDCKNHKELPFDFGINGSKGEILALIEYDGIQHFEQFSHFGGKSKFEQQTNNDSIKTNYCKDNNIALLRIPYTVSSLDDIKEKLVKFISNL